MKKNVGLIIAIVCVVLVIATVVAIVLINNNSQPKRPAVTTKSASSAQTATPDKTKANDAATAAPSVPVYEKIKKNYKTMSGNLLENYTVDRTFDAHDADEQNILCYLTDAETGEKFFIGSEQKFGSTLYQVFTYGYDFDAEKGEESNWRLGQIVVRQNAVYYVSEDGKSAYVFSASGEPGWYEENAVVVIFNSLEDGFYFMAK